MLIAFHTLEDKRPSYCDYSKHSSKFQLPFLPPYLKEYFFKYGQLVKNILDIGKLCRPLEQFDQGLHC